MRLSPIFLLLLVSSLTWVEAAQGETSESITVTADILSETPSELLQEISVSVNPSPEVLAQTQPTPAPAEDPRVLVAEVLVQGAQGELEAAVYQAIRTQPGRTTTRSQLQEDVNAVFATGLFSNVRVEPEDTALGVRITFVVSPNPVLRNVQVQTIPAGAPSQILPPEVVDEIFGNQYGQILNLRELQSDVQQLNQWYRDQGYDLAQVVGAPEVSPNGTVTLIVAEGVVEDIRVRYFDEEGEAVTGKTREFIITREIQLAEGGVFNRQLAQRDLQRVFGLGVFNDIRLSFEPGEDPSQVIVNVDVVERNTGSVAAGAGISSATGLFGTVSYQEQNLGGNAQNLGAEVQLGQRELLFNVRFTDPWIAGDPFRTSYTTSLFRRRSISLIFDGGENIVTLPEGDRPRIVRTGGGVTFTRPLAPDVFTRAEWVASAGLDYQRISVRDSDGDIAPVDQLGNPLSFSSDGTDDLVLLQLGAVRDQRNNPLRPTSGSVTRIGLDQSVPIGSGSILLSRLRGSYSQYIPVNFTNFAEGPQALAFNIQGGTVLGDLPPYEAFSLGGSNSVRGYNEGDVGSGRTYIQATAEYRFPVLNIIGGALFVDYATDLGSGSTVLGDPAGVRGKPGSGLGYGLGVRIQSPLGPIRLDYGFNDQGDARLHFGIGERF